MRRAPMAAASIVVTMSLLLAAGCGSSGASSTASKVPTNGSGQGAAAPKTVLVGAIYPLTGNFAQAAKAEKQAIELAEDIVNNAYPNLNLPLAKTAGLTNLGGAKIKVIFEDSEGNPQKAASAAQDLLSRQHVVALSGAYASSSTKTASAVAERQHIPYVTFESSAVDLTQRGYKWFFRTSPNDGTFVKDIFLYMNELRDQGKISKTDTLAMLHENSDFGTGVDKLANQYAQEYGYKVVTDIAYPDNITNADSEVQKLKASGATIVVQTSYTPDSILFTRTMANLHYQPKAIFGNDGGFDEPGYIQGVGKLSNGIMSRSLFATDLEQKKALIAQVAQLYKQRYGEDINELALRAMTGFLTLADAINRAGSTDPAAIQKALQETNIPADEIPVPWDGVKFDQTGQNILGKAIIVQIQNGQYRTVWPSNLASTQLIWPLPKWTQ